MTRLNYKSVALDGPSGAGKSTMAKRLAATLGFLYVDTGAIYRTLGLFVLKSGASPGEWGEVEPLLPKVSLRMAYGEDDRQHMYLGDEDVTEAIRQPEVSDAASKISAIPEVRAFLMDMQRNLAESHDVVMDGRDIGTVVLPKADVKIFLTASLEARAMRRYAELLNRGNEINFDTVLADMKERDQRDSGRAVAPLKQAEDAVLVDTTDKNLEESFRLLLQTVRERLS